MGDCLRGAELFMRRTKSRDASHTSRLMIAMRQRKRLSKSILFRAALQLERT